MKPIGRTAWAVPGGWIPFDCTGHEPTFTSHDRIAVLNAGNQDARLELLIHHVDREPVGPYRLAVPARRVRQVRLNDLIDPEALSLDTPYAVVVRSNIPVVVQFGRQDTGHAARAIAGTLADAEAESPTA